MGCTIRDLPTEVIQQILLYIPASTIPAFQLACQRFNQAVSPLIWRQLCKTRFRYWRSEHRIKDRLTSHIDDTNWKTIFVERYLVESSTTKLIGSILSSQTGRIQKFQRILEYGYDAKDCLLEHFETLDSAEDVLARRYYSDAVLGCLHRAMAIREWSTLKDGEEVALERALGAFDMFVLQNRKGDFVEITERLDDIAHSIQAEIGDFNSRTAREKASLIATHLRLLSNTKSAEQGHHHDLQSNFIAIALHFHGQALSPLISAAIYCCIARRLGVDASPCAFPFHVIVIITSPDGIDLDGFSTSEQHSKFHAKKSTMYLDPSNSDSEISVEDLITRLISIGAPQSTHHLLLEASTISEIVMRTGRNIINSVQESHRTAMAREGHDSNALHRGTSSSSPDLESSFYSALWASLLLGIPPDGDGPVVALRRRNYLPHIVELFETHFPTDVSLIEAYIAPLFQHTAEYAQIRESVRVMRSVDSMPKHIKRRNKTISEHVRYRVGQVFLHKRYDYQAVITGWDVECGADEHWMAQMRVHELSRGRQQSFYHVLVEDKSVRYVAEENIELIWPQNPQSLINLAGRHFKRWDQDSRRFVSNIEDEYPEG